MSEPDETKVSDKFKEGLADILSDHDKMSQKLEETLSDAL